MAAMRDEAAARLCFTTCASVFGDEQRKMRMIGTLVKLCPNDALFFESFGTVTSVSSDNKKCLIELSKSVLSAGVEYQHVVGRVRNLDESLLELLASGETDVRATWIPSEKLGAAQEFDVSWWRGGLASSVTLRRANSENF